MGLQVRDGDILELHCTLVEAGSSPGSVIGRYFLYTLSLNSFIPRGFSLQLASHLWLQLRFFSEVTLGYSVGNLSSPLGYSRSTSSPPCLRLNHSSPLSFLSPNFTLWFSTFTGTAIHPLVRSQTWNLLPCSSPPSCAFSISCLPHIASDQILLVL